jgi:hypothetical protein
MRKIKKDITDYAKLMFKPEETESEAAFLADNPEPEVKKVIFDKAADGGKGALKVWDGSQFKILHTRPGPIT